MNIYFPLCVWLEMRRGKPLSNMVPLCESSLLHWGYFSGPMLQTCVWAVFRAAYLPHSTSSSKSTLNHMRLLPHRFWVCHFALLLLSPPRAPASPEFFLSAYISLCQFLSYFVFPLLLSSLYSPSFSLQHGGAFLTVCVCVILCACAHTWICVFLRITSSLEVLCLL